MRSSPVAHHPDRRLVPVEIRPYVSAGCYQLSIHFAQLVGQRELQLYLYIPPPPPPASPPPPPEPPPHAEESVWKPGVGIHPGCRPTGPFIMFIELEKLR